MPTKRASAVALEAFTEAALAARQDFSEWRFVAKRPDQLSSWPSWYSENLKSRLLQEKHLAVLAMCV